MSAEPTGPGRAPADRHPAFDEMAADVVKRSLAMAADQHADVWELWRERGHPLVRAALRSGRRRRRFLVGFGMVFPQIVLAAALLLGAVDPGLGPWLLCAFACLWPAYCALGAGLAAAGSVVDERSRDTAMQLVLTPLSKRAIAASKVLPAVRPFLWAALAALPAYALAGSSEALAAGGIMPTPLILWPLRLFMPLLGDPGGEPSVSGVVVGALMAATDLGLVWISAHWGAAYAVRLGSLPTAALYLAGRMLLTALQLMLCCLAAVGTGLLGTVLALLTVAFFSDVLAGLLAIAAMLAGFYLSWRRYVMRRPVRAVLQEFTWFDRLADDEYQPAPLRGLEILPEYGERT